MFCKFLYYIYQNKRLTVKYIFVAGAPGSKWSSVVKNIYYSASIDSSDYSDRRTYWHSAWGKPELMHIGAYWDPGMEFGDFFNKLDQYAPEACEAEFDRPFSGTGIKIVKSHVFCHHLDYLKLHWPDCPIVVVHRENNACLDWWIECGQFNITYPDYHSYYVNVDRMYKCIKDQNRDLLNWLQNNKVYSVGDNVELCRYLGIQVPDVAYRQDYHTSDIKVNIKI